MSPLKARSFIVVSTVLLSMRVISHTTFLCLALSLCLICVAPLAWAQHDERMTVTATRSQLPFDKLTAVTIIRRADIELYQYRYLSDALRTVPGLYIARSGNRGAQTSLFTRGSESNHTIVYIDGVKVTDPSFDGVFALEQYQLHGVERIEVLRGAYSAQLGSEAIGGVINIITDKAAEKSAAVEVEYGSHHTQRLSTQLANHGDRWYGSFALSGFQTHGESHTAHRLSNINEDDGYRNIDYKLHANVTLHDHWNLRLQFSGLDSKSEYDDGFAPAPLENEAEQDKNEQRYSAVLKHQTQHWTTYLQLSRLQVNTHQSNGSLNRGRRNQLTWHSDLWLQPSVRFTSGIEYEAEHIHTANVRKHANNYAAYVGVLFVWSDHFTWAANVRYDKPQDVSAELNAQVSLDWAFADTLSLYANYGTAFKTPTLSERFGFAGNQALVPEDSRSYEFGIRKSRASAGSVWDTLAWQLTYFNNQINDLITYNFLSSQLENINTANIEGLEVDVSLRPWDALTYGANLTLLSAADQNKQRLLRRPARQANVYLQWSYTPGGTLALHATHTGARKDVDRTTFARVSQAAYTIYRASLTYQFNPKLSGTLRLENMFDKDYEPNNGFQGQGFGLFTGLRYRF